MSYATSACNNVSDLLSAIQAFAITEGWTINAGKSARSDGNGECVNITKTGTDGTNIAGAFYSHTVNGGVNEPGYYIGTYTYATYSGAQGNMAQTSGATVKVMANGFGTGGFVAYHLFGGPNHIHVVVEVTSGTYTHFGLGMLDKLGTVVTGVYSYGRRWYYNSTYWTNINDSIHGIPFDSGENSSRVGQSCSLRADSDGFGGRILDCRNDADSTLHMAKCGWRDTAWGDIARGLYYNQPPSSLTGRSLLVPSLISSSRGSQKYSPLGYFPDVRYVRMEKLVSGASVVIGPDTWRAFPYIRRNGATGEPSSGYYGLAFLQRP